MRYRRNRNIAASMAVFLVCVAWAASATGQTRGKTVVSPEDWKAIDHCLQIIRQCQTPDGMIRMNGAGELVWTVPYFSNFAAMALLAANDARVNPRDVHDVQRWLLWYANNQEPDGTICDRQGTLSAYKSDGKRDSTDSYAATFLMVIRRYKQAIDGEPPPEITNAAAKALAAIQAVVQEDGLTIAKPDYPIKYLMDNTEVYGGLQEGASFFDSVGRKTEAGKARKTAAGIARSLGEYWSDEDRCFAYALDMNGKFSGGLSEPYPHGFAQLFALAHIAPVQAGLWQTVSRKFKPDGAGMPVERWLIAAARCGNPEEKAQFRRATRQAVHEFTVDNSYVHRPAIAVLALIDGRARFLDVPTSSTE